ncbi:hypothetical protein IOD13_15155 [Brevibacterium casei]|nr:hypothetical protein [Brevibacterium casei]
MTVPVGRGRRMFELVESAPGTPSQRSRMLRADWGLSAGRGSPCGIRSTRPG